MKFHRAFDSGITLVEVLVTVGILAFLTIFFAPRVVFKAKDRTDAAIRKMIVKQISVTKITANRSLCAITGSTWSAQPCVQPPGIESPQCEAAMDRVFRLIGFDGAIKNPWGFYYFINENEGENFHGGAGCSNDRLHSYRPLSPGGAMAAPYDLVPFTILRETAPGSCL